MMMYVFQLQFIVNLLTPGENTDQPLPNSPYIQLPNLRFNSTEVLMKRRLFALTCRIFPQMVPIWVYAHQFSFVSMFDFFRSNNDEEANCGHRRLPRTCVWAVRSGTAKDGAYRSNLSAERCLGVYWCGDQGRH